MTDPPVAPPTAPPDCVDPATGAKYWGLLTHTLAISDEQQLVPLLNHPYRCAPCRTLLAKEWLRIRQETTDGKEAP